MSGLDGNEDLKELAVRWTRAMWSAKLWRGTTWMGLPLRQWPTDLLVLQEVLCRQRPGAVVETGTAEGGLAYFFACILDHLGGGRVVSVDRETSDAARREISSRPLGSRVTLLTGDSKSPETVSRVERALGGEKNVLVFLDSDHSYAHVKAELLAYRRFIPRGGYLIAADTICAELSKIPGQERFIDDHPLRAADEFLAENPDFSRDARCEKFLVTFCPGGFLRRAPG